MNKLQALLKKHGACDEAREWAKQFRTPAQAWEACAEPSWLAWASFELRLFRDDDKCLLWWEASLAPGWNAHGNRRHRCDVFRRIFGNPFRKARKKATVSARSPQSLCSSGA